MNTPAFRLREAREKAGFDSGRAAAEAMDVPTATYTQHENGSRGFPASKAQRYAAFFGTTPEWLLYGRTKRTPSNYIRVIGVVGANTDGSTIMTTAHDSWDMVPPPPGGTSRAVALVVRGNSMHTLADDGAIIYFEDQQTPPGVDLLGYPCVVETEDGRVLFKRLLRGSGPGLYDLESVVGDAIRDVRLRWAAEVISITPPRQARRVLRRDGIEAA